MCSPIANVVHLTLTLHPPFLFNTHPVCQLASFPSPCEKSDFLASLGRDLVMEYVVFNYLASNPGFPFQILL